MNINRERVRALLRESNFKALFIEELGWDIHRADHSIQIGEHLYRLSAVAEKRGVQCFICQSDGKGKIPDYSTRRRIDTEVRKIAHEHLLIFTDAAKTRQIWQWVAREPGKPSASREWEFNRDYTGEALIQKLGTIAFTLSDEEALTVLGVTIRLKDAFDKDRVTKRFYDRFKKQLEGFITFVKGIPTADWDKWYASVMINRLMFIYFLQKKGFLDGNQDYLKDKLTEIKSRGKDRYYRDFLCPLFFQGFARKPDDRSPEHRKLLGQVPYLNGGLFLKHQIEEQHGTTIQISDDAFTNLFAFFDQYQWHLDDRPLRADNEINPEVLGYIFEKYTNQKQMGAYYTKEDITDYIGKNTIIPYLLDEAKRNCKIAFEPDGSVWRLLKADPDRYIYLAVRKGVIDDKGEVISESVLPDFVQIGMHDPKARMFDKRYNLGDAKGNVETLPTETWREYVERRKRCLELRTKLLAGEVHDVNDLITYNLNIRQFAQDVVEQCEGSELLRALWKAIREVSILDPTCGSGAFLFAALNILEPLYDACLARMQAFVEELDASGQKHSPEKFSDFRKALALIEQHPNRKYFILKSIIINNLYGVDIMDEAVEICKLRFFLKLVAQLESPDNIEPLPDIDFNIRTGNTLVGYATRSDVEKAMIKTEPGQGAMVFPHQKQAYDRFIEKLENVDHLFIEFRRQQTELGGEVKVSDKQEIQRRLKAVEDGINPYLASEYGIDLGKKAEYSRWNKSHKPFHWFVEFYGIMSKGGFDVIIGNPPYLEQKQVDYNPKGYPSSDTGAIHAICVECGTRLLHVKGCMSMIVPMALPSTQRMAIVQRLLEATRSAWYSNYGWRPAKLFDTVNRALTIFVTAPASAPQTFSTNYQKWTSDNRDGLFSRLTYVQVPRARGTFWVPKLGSILESRILEKCLKIRTLTKNFIGSASHQIYYRTTGGLYWKVFTDFAPAFRVNGKAGHSSRETWFNLVESNNTKPMVAALSSDLYWWWYTISSNLRDMNPYDIQNFPLPESALADAKLRELGVKYLNDMKTNSTMLVREQKQTGRTETQSFKIQTSKPIIDEIDQVLARHYGFTDEELDFIINYDIKYRMGRGAGDSEEEE